MRIKFMFAIILFSLIVILTGGYMAYRAVSNPYDFPIDLVYTWVDGNDPVWQAKKAYWQKQYAPDDEYAISPARWRDRDELKYSLRSVEQYMPWVNNIYIVTDNQVPAWLNINHPKIKIVDHSEIFPAEALPVFNSIAIESRLAHIPDLSEHFIYSNDDFFTATYLSPDFFFTADGKPIFYQELYSKSYINGLLEQYKDEMWAKLWQLPTKLIAEKFGGEPFYMIDTHTMGAISKSDFLEAEKIFPEEFKRTTYSKFRTENDLNFGIVSMLEFLNQRVVVKGANQVDKKFNCKTAGVLIMGHMEELESKKPCQFCLNDTQTNSEELNRKHVLYMQQKFPYKSAFEK